ncbi:hypothetical protein WCU61_07280 [Pectobacterium versatile]|uniref:hypothetical protein n=1 Tax=Pectobacterium versatile TaxID=2488639 RepID=UPI003015E40F
MQRQAMGVALHIVLLPFLNYCIAQLIHTMPTVLSAFFCPSILTFSVIPQATLPNAFGILLWWATRHILRAVASDVVKCLWHFIMVGYRATPSGPSQATL